MNHPAIGLDAAINDCATANCRPSEDISRFNVATADKTQAIEEEHNMRHVACAIAHPEQKPWPKKLLEPEGLIGEMSQAIRKSSLVERPSFALGAALAVGATLLGGGVWDGISYSALNLYVMALLEAGGGKEDPFEAASEILRQVGLESMVLPPPASGAGLTDSVIATPVGLLPLDEAGDFLNKMLGSGKPDPNQLEMKKVIKELYSRSKYRGMFYQTQRARNNNNQLDAAKCVMSPSISIYLTSAPSRIANALTSGEVKDGFIPRFLFFAEEGSKRINLRTRHTPIPHELIAKLKNARKTLGWSEESGAKPPTIFLKTTEEAMDIFQHMEDETRYPKDQQRAQGDYAAGVWGRCVENARRVAGIIACLRAPDSPEIDEYAARYGCDLLMWTCANAERFVRGKIADDPFHRQVLKVRETFKHYGTTEGEKFYKIPRWLLSKKAGLKIEDLDAVLDFMRETHELVCEENQTITRKARVYWLTSSVE